MSEPERIAELLSDGTDLAAAALLVATYRGEAPRRSHEDGDLWEQLLALGCLIHDRITPLGAQVAMRLEALHFGERD